MKFEVAAFLLAVLGAAEAHDPFVRGHNKFLPEHAQHRHDHDEHDHDHHVHHRNLKKGKKDGKKSSKGGKKENTGGGKKDKGDGDRDLMNIFNTRSPPEGTNVCDGAGDPRYPNVPCYDDGGCPAIGGQSGVNVTKGYQGDLEADHDPLVDPYYMKGLCPINVHWHLGAEHLSEGQYDEHGKGPNESHDHDRKLAADEDVRLGFRCHHYDPDDEKFTKPYDWKYCVNMEVGETYEVHWPHSAVGACGTLNQYQTPFYDGVLCHADKLRSDVGLQVQIGVQGQIFTIVNDEDYFYPDLIAGMIVDGDIGSDIAKYTGSTTGTTRDNEICSQYTPITWQVDRVCHMVSASTFDKMCADMMAQRDDMSGDLYPHGARMLVDDALAYDNHMDGFRD